MQTEYLMYVANYWM